jgi:hypothetical protein
MKNFMLQTIQNRKPALRLFNGMAGQPLARINKGLERQTARNSVSESERFEQAAGIVVEILKANDKKRRGRPAKNKLAMTGAERVWLHRNRKKMDDAIKEIMWEHRDGKGTGQTMYVGGTADLELIDNAARRSNSLYVTEDRPPQKSNGPGPDSDPADMEQTVAEVKETDSTFQKRHRFPKEFDAYESKEAIVVAALMKCMSEVPVDSLPEHVRTGNFKTEYICGVCNQPVGPWPNDCKKHLETVHPALIASRIRETFPTRKKKSKA